MSDETLTPPSLRRFRSISLSAFLLTITAAVILCAFYFRPQTLQKAKELDPVILVNRLDVLRFSIVVANSSSEDIKLGRMVSALGMDQFAVEIKTEKELIELNRDIGTITVDPRRPLLIPSGGHHEFTLDLGDGCWFRKSTKKSVSPELWKDKWEAVRVRYKRSESDFQNAKTITGERKDYGLLIGELQSRWIDPQFPRKRFREELQKKLFEEIDELQRTGKWGTPTDNK